MMTIAKLAAAGGVGVETVRYYQRRGLLAEPARGVAGAVRRYGEEDVKRLRFIRAAQAAGFTLEEVGQLIALHASDDRPQAHALARARIAALDARIGELTAARAALHRLASECAAGNDGPCPILNAFDGGNGGVARPG